MSETHFNFTQKKIQALPSPVKGRKEYHDTGCPSLTIVVTSAGTKTFHRYGRVMGKPQRIRIATFPEFSVENARDACSILTGKIAQGVNPNEERLAKRKEKTLGELWAWYLEHHAKKNKRTWMIDEKVWTRDVCHLAGRRLSTISRAEVKELRDATIAKYKPSSGRRIVELLSGMYAIAIDNEWTEKNPAYRIGKPAINERERFLQPSELQAFFRELAKLQPRSRDFILICLYTGARRDNVLTMRWGEINWDSHTWVIPKEKAKGKEPLSLPLSDLALEVLKERRKAADPSPWVFPSTASKTGHYVEPKFSWATLLKEAKLNNLRIHDLRRTLGSWQASAGVSLQIIGESLGHRNLRSTEIYARLQSDPVREAVNNATKAIRKAGEKTTPENNSENSESSFSAPEVPPK
jgi:integrase